MSVIFNVIGLILTLCISYLFIYEEQKHQKEINESLETIVAERTQELQNEKDAKTTFFINLAHETKTPLTLIKNYLSRYRETQKKTDLDILEQNVDKLIRDMVNFLDSEKLSRGQIFYHHDQIVDFSGFLTDKIRQFDWIASKKKICIHRNIENDLYLKADPYALDRIINNLLDNAIKYTAEAGYIAVQLRSDHQHIQLIVTDTGIGISEEQQKHIFLPYHQTSCEKRNIQGIGMGLAIVKQIIDSLAGTISVESQINQGAVFKVTLNRYQPEKNETIRNDVPYSVPLDRGSKPVLHDLSYIEGRENIYIVEDNIELLAYIRSELARTYNVFYALNGEEALEKIRSIPEPGLILSDVMMDRMDGFEFCDKLRNDLHYAHIPFIFLTAKTAAESKITGLKEGAMDYIAKPFIMEELELKIKNILQQVSLAEENIKLKSKNIDLSAFEQKCNLFNLSPREIQIIDLLLKNPRLKYREIARIINIGEKTVNSHMQNIYDKALKLTDIFGYTGDKIRPNKLNILEYFSED
ncbi:MAG: ATP-binding protein [Spirochaetes bacterium]|nr:ATP-binding protein [Spirochaetota bacterium]